MKKRQKQVYRKAVFVVVFRKNHGKIEYLILKRKLHWTGWEFPKGGVEGDESLRKAALREFREETGLRAIKIRENNICGSYRYSRMFKDRPGIIGQKYKLFSVLAKKGKVKLSKKEHSAFKWLSFDKAIKKITHKNQKKCLKIVDKILKK